MTLRMDEINQLFYITHINNIPSILKKGIYSHKLIEEEGLQFTPIYNKEIVRNRKNTLTPIGKSLWEYANLYFNARNPMLYKVTLDRSTKLIAVIGVKKNILRKNGVFIADGNAARPETTVQEPSQALQRINSNILNMEYWTGGDGSKRRIMAEALIPKKVPPDHIDVIYVVNHGPMEKVRRMISSTKRNIIVEPYMFFWNERKGRIRKGFYLVSGDMFFSRLQTLTVSVNTVGVMGKGLASRAKYQFPDVYVHYQDLCKHRSLKMGRPYLYKREGSYSAEIADEPRSLKNGIKETWFLLFPTKGHWRDDSDLKGIAKGLDWIRDNAEMLGIKSLALPALGCGLGRLRWEDVGPLMCQKLIDLKMDIYIYLPTEKKVPEAQLKKRYLLDKKVDF